MKRLGFTLLEVNLAMFVMAVGTLGLVSLYSFGYRENRQSNEDVQCAAIAEKCINQLTMALSSTNMTWSKWCAIKLQPANGWAAYTTSSGRNGFKPLSNPNGPAGNAFSAVMSAVGWGGTLDPQGCNVGIVISPSSDINPRTYSIGVRCSKRAANLLYQPLYYSEVCFQGLADETESKGGGK